ncbi:MAG: carboxylating nicotinate-nucleotide diphosphorylase [Dehalococcoidales bacterium]|nr:carboxylating nicotinate-nucleotide diphosphorylase [Dehalococcoidales bacterium]
MNNFRPTEEQVNKIVDLALAEDTGGGDITSRILLPAGLAGRAAIVAKEEGILAGGDIARLVFVRAEPSLEVELLIPDGEGLKAGDRVATIVGNVAGILKAERVALNFLSRLSGVASETARYVARVKGFAAIITDTRKTSPGMRLLDKYAVRIGGGQNHRLHLGDSVLIKDNHITALRKLGMSLTDIIARAKKNAPEGLKIEIEVDTTAEAIEAANAGAVIILLDNMSYDQIKRVVELMPAKVKTEASGGITLDNVRTVALAGVDTISVGAITHSAKALDFSLELEPET